MTVLQCGQGYGVPGVLVWEQKYTSRSIMRAPPGTLSFAKNHIGLERLRRRTRWIRSPYVTLENGPQAPLDLHFRGT